jgi:hypothetical protein
VLHGYNGSVAYSVLVVPNITSPHDGLEADSYVLAVGQIIRALNRARDDLEFTMLTPRPVESWRDIPNLRQVEYIEPTYPNQMRAHFDTAAFLRAVQWKQRSVDIVWCHLPEHAVQIRNVLYNLTNERPVITGYCHWYEIPEQVTFSANTLALNLVGAASMEECGLNSEWLKGRVLHHAERLFGAGAFLDTLADKLVPMHLGIEPPEIPVVMPERGLFVWNHRLSEYTGWNAVVKVLDALWARRQDFKVMVTMADVDKPWAVSTGVTSGKSDAGNRTEYLTALARAWYGLPRLNAAWCMSVTDGLSIGVPYLLPAAYCYPEMFPDGYSFYDDLMTAIEAALDGGKRNVDALASLNAAERLYWDKRVTDWSAQFDRAIAALPMTGDRSKRYAELLMLPRRGASKADLMKAMGWGVGIPWTPYRNRLRRDGVLMSGDRYGMGGRPPVGNLRRGQSGAARRGWASRSTRLRN